MDILEIVGIGYLVNILGLLLIITMSIIEFYIRFYIDKVDVMKRHLALRAAVKKFENTKQECRELGVSPIIWSESTLLFPFIFTVRFNRLYFL